MLNTIQPKSCSSLGYELQLSWMVTFSKQPLLDQRLFNLLVRVLRRLVTLISKQALLQIEWEAAQKQAESATAAAKRFLEEQQNKV